MNSDKAEGIFDQAKGKLKQAFGEATDNQSVANEGAADQVKGHAKETWGNVKDAASDLSHSHDAARADADRQEGSHNFRDSVTHAAESAKDHIKSGLDHLTHKAND